MNRHRSRNGQVLTLAFVILLSCGPARSREGLHLEEIKLPPGFTISLYAANVENARSLCLGEKGTLFVSTRDAGKVFALLDRNGDHRVDEVITIATGLNMPNGIAFRDGALYVAEVNRVIRFDGIETRLKSPPPPVSRSGGPGQTRRA